MQIARPRKVPIQRLIFVYAANSGLLEAARDSARKLLRIKGCTLCSITHGLVGERSRWRSCRDAMGVPVEYRHRDELEGELAELVQERLPCVVARTDDGLRVLLEPEVIDRCHASVTDLRARLQVHAAMHGLTLPDSRNPGAPPAV